MSETQTLPRRSVDPAFIVILAGVCAALHVGKLPPAIDALQVALGVTLVQAGFLLSLVQVAGMLLGIGVGLAADGLGARRSMLIGLLVLALASALGGAARDVPMLMLLRACEGFGFLLVVLPAPGLIRRLVAPQRMNLMLGLWGTYMPTGAAAALLIGPLWIGAAGWRAWWWGLAGLSLLMALWLVRAVAAEASTQDGARALPDPRLARLRQTLAAPGPWLVAMTFAVYSGQWLAVIGFLPVIYTQAGLSGAATGVLTALAAAVNALGNVASGRLLHRGVAPARLLRFGFVVMGLAALAAFAGADSSHGAGLPPTLRYLAVLLFSMLGGVIPATLFALAVRLAPGENTLATTVGWVQQWSAFGQFTGPPLVAWVASRAGGWQLTWLVTGTCSLIGLLLVWRIAALLPASGALGQPR
jgi:MFS transporter, CP family, cyanate transporter